MKSVYSQPLLSANSPAPTRRSLLKGLTLVTIISMLKPTELLAQGDPAMQWRRMVCDLANSVCPGTVANYINSQVLSAPAYWTTGSTDFHQSFAAAFFLNIRIQPYRTISGGRFFEFDRYPFYDSHQPCRRIKDVNEIELTRFLDPDEREIYGGVVSPCSERMPFRAACHQDDFNRTAAAYETDPRAYEHLYVRNVTDGQNSYFAHAVKPRVSTSNRQPKKQVFLSPDSL